jgi:hypothetical protein
MQITLCAILAATLGLAMLVSHHKMAVKLSSIRWAGNVGARLPAGWVLEAENQPPVMFQIREPASDRPGRCMTIYSEQIRPGTTAGQYLKDSGLLLKSTEELGEQGSIIIAGAPGILVRRRREIQAEDGSATGMYESVWFASAVLHSGQAISIELACPIEIDSDADKSIIVNTARAMEVNGNAKSGF